MQETEESDCEKEACRNIRQTLKRTIEELEGTKAQIIELKSAFSSSNKRYTNLIRGSKLSTQEVQITVNAICNYVEEDEKSKESRTQEQKDERTQLVFANLHKWDVENWNKELRGSDSKIQLSLMN